MPTTHDIARSAADAGGKVLAAALAPLGSIRDAKPLHPDGTIRHATLEVTDPAPALQVPLFTESTSLPCLVRISRAIGLPAPLPDIGGLALRLRPDAAGGGQGDLLFASTGTGHLTRWLLLLRLDPGRSALTTLLPLSSASGPVLFSLSPVGREATAYQLSWARPRGDWLPLGRLTLGAALTPEDDPPIRFDPIENPVPGLTNYPAVTRLREPAYAAARRLWPSGLSSRLRG
jgi:hypothetical protein